jgi:hypothetical protein
MATVLSNAPGAQQRAGALPQDSSRVVAAWLLACCALVFAMVVVGGVTRLTHSGLSITEWQPIVGTVPPLSRGRLARRVRQYQATPEYRAGQSAACARRVQAHLLVGVRASAARAPDRRRVPRAVRVASRCAAHSRGYGAPLAGIFVLGGLQGALGWYMVQSGLSTIRACRSSVSRRTLPRIRDLRRDAVDGAVAARAARARPSRRRSAAWRFAARLAALVLAMIVTAASSPDSRGLRLQHVPADERARRAARDRSCSIAAWKNFF